MYVGRGCKSRLTKAQKDELYKMIESGPFAKWVLLWDMEFCTDCGTGYVEIWSQIQPSLLSSLAKKDGVDLPKSSLHIGQN
jgi:hypothetical protein